MIYSRILLLKNLERCNNTKFSFKLRSLHLVEISLFSSICLRCSYENSINISKSLKGHFTNNHLYYNHVRFQSSQINFNEKKLQHFFKHMNYDMLKSKYNINLVQETVIMELLQNKEKLEENLKELESMKENEANKEGNKDMLEMINEDILQYRAELTDIYKKIIDIVLPRGDFKHCNDILLEISAGVGGSEAQLFANDLFNMYISFIENRGWDYVVAENDKSELGGIRHCSILVSGLGAYSILQHEAGVHRVQRVPETEKGGRMHTSTVTVAILPQPSDVEINLKESDLKIESKRASGAGGQHVNTTDSAIRITHIPSGIMVECQSDRSQHKNRETALKKLKAQLYERELNRIDSAQRSQRKSQVGTSARAEKIRTYNFRDDRISDHRLSVNMHNMKNFLEGGEQFEKLLEQLTQWHNEYKLKQFINSLPS